MNINIPAHFFPTCMVIISTSSFSIHLCLY
jgi:hypothetical protein